MNLVGGARALLHLGRDEQIDKLIRIADGAGDPSDLRDDVTVADEIREAAGNDRKLINQALRRFLEGYEGEGDDLDDVAFLDVRSGLRLRLARDPAYQMSSQRSAWYHGEQIAHALTTTAIECALDGTWRDERRAVELLRGLAGRDVEALSRAATSLTADSPDYVIATTLLATAAGRPLAQGQLGVEAARVCLDEFAAFRQAARTSLATAWELLSARSSELAAFAEEAAALGQQHLANSERHRRTARLLHEVDSVVERDSVDPVLRTPLARAIATAYLLHLAGLSPDAPR
jgi:hypothetical protein